MIGTSNQPASSAVTRLAKIAESLPGVMSIAVGCAVLHGWYTDGAIVTHADPPLMPNTAVIFILCGFAVLLLAQNRRKMSGILAGMGMLICLAVAIQYVVGHSTGVDQLLVRIPPTATMPRPGRIDPSALSCLLLMSCLILLRSAIFPVRRALAVLSGLVGCVVSSLGIVTLVAHGFGIATLFAWGATRPMAGLSAVCFTLLGVEALHFGWVEDLETGSLVPNSLPALMAVGAVAYTLAIWHAMRKNLYVHSPTGESLLPAAVLMMGLTAGASIVLAVVYSRQSRRRTIGAEDARCRLESEIAERIRAEEGIQSSRRALEESEHRFRSVFDKAAMGIVLTSMEGKTLQVNDKACEIAGHTREELLAKGFRDLTFPDERLIEAKMLAKLTRGEIDHYSLEKRYATDDGAVRWYRLTQSLAKDSAGGELYTIGVLDDITERKEAERALRDSETRMRLFFDRQNVGLAITSPEKGMLEVNDRFCQMLGYTRDEMMRANWADLTHPDDVAADLAQFDRLLIGEINTYSLEKRFFRKSGEVVWVDLSVGCVRRPNRSVEFLLGAVIDTTERRLAEKALVETKERFESIFNDAVVGLYRTTADGRVLMVNPALCAMLGYDAPDELLKVDIQNGVFAAGYSRDEFKNRLETDGVIRGLESAWKRRDGSTVYVRENATAVRDSSGSIIYYEGTVEDVTARKKAQEESAELQGKLTQSQKMEAVGQLAGGVAHDFNNLLMIIMSQSELLLESLKDPDDLSRARDILDATERAADVTRQLLAFSRKQILQPVVVSLGDIVQDNSRLLRKAIREDIELSLSLADDAWPVKIDRVQIFQVIMNLVVNARDAMPSGGKLSIATFNQVVGEEYLETHPMVPPGCYAVLSVSDTGTGMDEQTRSRVFEPFFTTKGIGAGTGMGLSTVYGIVKQSGGFIWVYSEPGRGSSFKIYLPSALAQDLSVIQSKMHPPLVAANAVILMVEDDPKLRRVISGFLQGAGYHVIASESAAEATSLAQESAGQIDVLLTDVILPGENGRVLADSLREMGFKFRVIYMSGYTADAIAQHGVLEAGVHFLQKPFTRDTLLHKLAEVLEVASVRRSS